MVPCERFFHGKFLCISNKIRLISQWRASLQAAQPAKKKEATVETTKNVHNQASPVIAAPRASSPQEL
jgi:hypothetical protein